jgi:uncharacterized protein (DUF58 family)
MSRPIFLGFLVFVLLFVGLVTLQGAILALTIPLLLYLSYGFWRGPEEIKLVAQRELSAERIASNEPVRVKVTIINNGDNLEELRIEDILSSSLKISDGSNHHSISLAKDGKFEFGYTLQGPRGNYSLEALRFEATDCFGILQTSRTVLTNGRLFVFPPVTKLKLVSIQPRRTRIYAGNIPARVGGAGVEFFGVRDYQAGDPTRWINWRVSARHVNRNAAYETLYSTEFQQERVADVAIILDGRERANIYSGGHSLFEHSVLAAAAMSDGLLAQGNRVGLLVYGHYLQWTLPGYGKLQRERILNALAHASLGPSQVFDDLQFLPVRAFPPESQIVLISPIIEGDINTLVQLRARGYQVLVMCPDSVAFEENYLPRQPEVRLAARIIRMERQLTLTRLKRAGIRFVDWNVSQPFDQAVGQALRFHRPIGNRL